MKLTTLVIALSFLSACSLWSKEEPEPKTIDQKVEEVAQKAQQQVKTIETSKPDSPVWSYQGVLGPANWGDLAPQFNNCKSGKEQSPIHLIWSRPKATGPQISFDYKMSNLAIVDTGHTLQINVEPGNRAKLNGRSYELQQIHFHSSSEHSLSGNILPMEIHYVHKSAQGELAVVGFFAIEGQAHSMITQLWPFIPPQAKNTPVNLNKLFNPISMLPKKFHHYSYRGSLTTPPCTEGVRWFVLNTPVTFSKDQILQFRQLYSINNRPIQPLNNRRVTNH